jgi:hypothetical protein
VDAYAAYWRTLDLEPGAGVDEIKRAYREQALTWHPDRFPYDESLRKRCEERMRLVNAAYEALRDLAENGPPPEPGPEEPAAPPAEPPWPRARPRPPEPERPPRRQAASDVGPWDGEDWRPAPEEPRVEPGAPPEWASLSSLAAAFAAAGLALVTLFLLPNQTWQPYWKVMRLVTCPALGYGAAIALARRSWEMGLGLLLLSVALNPVLPVAMSLEDWRIFNGLTPVLLALMWFWISRHEPGR